MYCWRHAVAMAVLAVAPVLGGPDDAAPHVSTPTLTSASDMFRVAQFPSADGIQIMTWADDVLSRLQSQLSASLPDFAGQSIHIAARPPDTGPARVVKAQGWVDGYLAQKLVIIDPPGIDQEDMLAGLCWLLLNRYAIAHQSMAERKEKLAVTPDWFAVGLAQSLFPELRERQFRVVLDRWERGADTGVAAMLGKAFLPPGRWPEKDVCGVLVDWLMDADGKRPLIYDLSRVWGSGQEITEAWLVERLGMTDPAALERAWHAWVNARAPFTQTMGVAATDRIEALRRSLAGLCEDTTLAALIRSRGDPLLTRRLSGVDAEIEALALGAPAAFSDVVGGYRVYLRGLAQTSDQSDLTDADLARILETTEQALLALERAAQDRPAFLDRVEQRLGGGAVSVPAASNYLDEVERRLATQVSE